MTDNQTHQCIVCGHVVRSGLVQERCSKCHASGEFPVACWLRGNWHNNRGVKRHCNSCGHSAVYIKHGGPSHGHHLLLSLSTCGIWLLVWTMLLFLCPFRCTCCGKRKWAFERGQCAGVFKRGACSEDCLCKESPSPKKGLLMTLFTPPRPSRLYDQ